MANELKVVMKNGTSFNIPASNKANTKRMLGDAIEEIKDANAPVDKPTIAKKTVDSTGVSGDGNPDNAKAPANIPASNKRNRRN